MKYNRLLSMALLTMGLSLVIGCEAFKMKKPTKIITVHEIVKYPRAKQLEKEIMTFSGDKIWINSNPFLHSKSVEEIKLIPIEGQKDFYNLELKLDRHGALVWMQLSVGFAHKRLAFVIDDVYYRSFIISQKTTENDHKIVIKGPFDKITAESLKEHAKDNYKYYNEDEDDPFKF